MALPVGHHPGRAAIGQDGLLYDNKGNVLAIASGTVTLDGTNPTDVVTGLTSIVGAAVSLKQATTPGDDPSWLSCDWSGGTLSIYAWKNTGGTDPTLVASTNNTAVVTWMAQGQ
jgi:hypothetical protein